MFRLEEAIAQSDMSHKINRFRFGRAVPGLGAQALEGAMLAIGAIVPLDTRLPLLCGVCYLCRHHWGGQSALSACVPGNDSSCWGITQIMRPMGPPAVDSHLRAAIHVYVFIV